MLVQATVRVPPVAAHELCYACSSRVRVFFATVRDLCCCRLLDFRAWHLIARLPLYKCGRITVSRSRLLIFPNNAWPKNRSNSSQKPPRNLCDCRKTTKNPRAFMYKLPESRQKAATN
ncbi:hypothetical protein AMTR_s00075p00121980 [Amborella trichopoda]|uniref:Uncharacterized protein n=1 Tax=Amborella trichopoda TaxID=13333 RepID=W1PAG9_AMBTC|nr:hypothetical protein AMTR_s00075p00121980 [Amborella trichopoda]